MAGLGNKKNKKYIIQHTYREALPILLQFYIFNCVLSLTRILAFITHHSLLNCDLCVLLLLLYYYTSLLL